MKYQQLDSSATTAQRVAVLVEMLRSNPAQPGAMMELASDAASVGLVDPSLIWYDNALTLSNRMGYTVDYPQLTAYTSELIVADQLRTADGFLQKILEHDQNNSDAAILELLVASAAGRRRKLSRRQPRRDRRCSID